MFGLDTLAMYPIVFSASGVTVTRHTLVIPVSDYSANNKTISDEIRKENKTTYDNNVVVVASSLLITETTQRILPYPP